MRIVTYNVEWFNSLFDDRGHMLDDDRWSARHNVTRADQLAALAIVFTALDADAVMIIEAPDDRGAHLTAPALEGFATAAGIRARRAVVGFENATQQEIACLYDPDRLCMTHDPQGTQTGKKGDPDAPRFDGVFRIDLDIDATEDLVTFSKPPLELAVRSRDGVDLRMIGVHLKSKAPHGAQGRDEIISRSIANRRKQQAQALWLRQRIDQHVAAGDALIVLGDLNDGPGLDSYETLFGRSSVEIVMGQGRPDAEQLYDPHAREALFARPGAFRSTSRFYIPAQKRYLQALLDYVMISPDLRARSPAWRIWHPFDDPGCWSVPELRSALLTASDHFPVSLDISL